MEELLQRRWDEVEALQAMYPGQEEFQLLEGGPPGSDEGQGVLRFRLQLLTSAGLSWEVDVDLPLGYPKDARPEFFPKVTSASRAKADALSALALECLAGRAAERAGEECIYEALQELETIQGAPEEPQLEPVNCSEKLQEEEWCRTLVRIDHMNEPKTYTKALEGFAAEIGASLVLFFRQAPQGRYRHICGVLDAPSKESASIFLRNLRTQPVDVDGRGEPCKERCAEVAEQLILPHGSHEPGFLTVEYGAAEELEKILEQARNGLDSRDFGAAVSAGLHGYGWVAAARGGGAVLTVAVKPGRKVSEITNLSELRRMPNTSALCADLRAQPREGEANQELLKLLAKQLQLPSSNLSLISGGKTRDKQVLISGLGLDEVVSRLLGGS